MTDRLLEIATRPEGPSARARLPFDKLARVLDVPTVPTPELAKAAQQAERVTVPPPDRIPTTKDLDYRPPASVRLPDIGGPGMSAARFDTGAAHRAAQHQARQAEAAAPAPTIDPHAGRSLSEAMLTNQAQQQATPQLDRLAAILDKPSERPTPTIRDTPTPTRGPGKDSDRDR
jgi:hypothetical protein